MFAHNKRIQYTVRVNETHPGLDDPMLEPFQVAQAQQALVSPSNDLKEDLVP